MPAVSVMPVWDQWPYQGQSHIDYLFHHSDVWYEYMNWNSWLVVSAWFYGLGCCCMIGWWDNCTNEQVWSCCWVYLCFGRFGRVRFLSFGTGLRREGTFTTVHLLLLPSLFWPWLLNSSPPGTASFSWKLNQEPEKNWSCCFRMRMNNSYFTPGILLHYIYSFSDIS